MRVTPARLRERRSRLAFALDFFSLPPMPKTPASSQPGSSPSSRQKDAGAAAYLPRSLTASLPQLQAAAQKCRGCDLYKNATQAVMGEGEGAAGAERKNAGSMIMLIGEQPGDQEDLQGHPFVGPAGKMLDRALAEAGIDRSQAFVTNAVKHFKWTPAPRGKRRLHSKPNAGEVRACRPWLEREVMLVRPAVLVPLGATAGQALMGPSFRVGAMRGKVVRDFAFAGWTCSLVATIHPSALLRLPEDADREKEFRAFVKDLEQARRALDGASSAAKTLRAV